MNFKVFIGLKKGILKGMYTIFKVKQNKICPPPLSTPPRPFIDNYQIPMKKWVSAPPQGNLLLRIITIVLILSPLVEGILYC